VIDGDTVDVDIDLGFDIILKKQRVRLAGIDTPESRTSDLEEKKYGLKAKKFLVEYLAKNNPNNDIILKTTSYDAKGKFGRILGEIFNLYGAKPSIEGNPGSTQSANELLIENAHAVRYEGQSKSDIAEGHLINRKLVDIDEDDKKYKSPWLDREPMA
jgi:micrococcal nuclease